MRSDLNLDCCVDLGFDYGGLIFALFEEEGGKGRLCRGKVEEDLSLVRGALFLGNGPFCFVLDAFVLECSSLIGLFSHIPYSLDCCSCSILCVLSMELCDGLGFCCFFTEKS